MRKFAALAAAVLTAVTLFVAPAPAMALPTFKVLTIGDSITVGTGGNTWQSTFCSLASSKAGVDCSLTNAAVGQTRCDYWPSRIAALMTSAQPDVVVLACGTNDDPTAMIYGESVTSWSVRATIQAVHDYRPASMVPMVVALPQYSDPTLAYSPVTALLDNEPIMEDRVYSAVSFYLNQGWPLHFADLQYVPATATYLDSGGIHSTARGYAYDGTIFYGAAAALLGWPAPAPLCDLYGHRRGYPRPSFTPCTYA